MKEQIQNRIAQMTQAITVRNPAKHIQFPNIPLTIPESVATSKVAPLAFFLTSRMFLFNFMLGFLLTAMVIVGKDIQQNNQRLSVSVKQRDAIVQQVNTWQSVVGKYPGYRDGYYQLAILQDQLGNRQLAYGYIIKAIQVDPDFVEGKQLLEEIIQ